MRLLLLVALVCCQGDQLLSKALDLLNSDHESTPGLVSSLFSAFVSSDKHESLLDDPKSLDPKLQKKAEALQLLDTAGYTHGNHAALGILGDIWLFSRFGIARNASRAYEYYSALATLGNSTGSRMLALMHAVGIGAKRDYSKAQLHASFGALDGDLISMHLLGYWNHAGIGMPKNCPQALSFYKSVAEKVMKEYRSGPTGSKLLPKYKVFVGEDERVYGKYASGSGSYRSSNFGLKESDLLLVYRLQAEAGDAASQFMVGQYHYIGSQTQPPDYVKAFHYFNLAVQHPIPDVATTEEQIQLRLVSAQSAGYLGEMYWKGEGVEANVETARKWFERGVALGNAASFFGLGMMHLKGEAGFQPNLNEARRLLYEAAYREHTAGMVNYAELLLKSPDKLAQWSNIIHYLTKSSQKGNVFAHYLLGEIYQSHDAPVPYDCQLSVEYFKKVVEKASFHDQSVQKGYVAYLEKDFESAFIRYVFSAETGSDTSQLNAAWIVDNGLIVPKAPSRIFFTENSTVLWDPYDVALPLWVRAGNQGNVDARVKTGDYLYYGLGGSAIISEATMVKKESEDNIRDIQDVAASTIAGYISSKIFWAFAKPGARRSIQQPELAATYYTTAAESQLSSIAMFNLGFMYENGIGLPKDYHLAKRYYDLALSTNPSVFLPVKLALFKMNFVWTIESFLFKKKAENESPLIPPIPTSSIAGPQTSDDKNIGGGSSADRKNGKIRDKTFDLYLFTFLVILASIILFLRQNLQQRGAQNVVAARAAPSATNPSSSSRIDVNSDQNGQASSSSTPSQETNSSNSASSSDKEKKNV